MDVDGSRQNSNDGLNMVAPVYEGVCLFCAGTFQIKTCAF